MLACGFFLEHIKKCINMKNFLNINSLQKYFVPPKVLIKLIRLNPAVSIKSKKAGSCLFFHSKLIHGSSHNISPADRKILLYDISSLKDYKRQKKIRFNHLTKKSN